MNFRLYNTKTFITGILAEITTNTPIVDKAIDFANTARQIYNCTTPAAPVIIADDASENTKSKFVQLSTRFQVPYIVWGNRESLSHAIGKYNRAVYGISNKKFSRELRKIYEEMTNCSD